jgi:hypothetical protein
MRDSLRTQKDAYNAIKQRGISGNAQTNAKSGEHKSAVCEWPVPHNLV